MISLLLTGLCLGLVSGLRGPHHPRSPISHHHYTPQSDVKITQDTELLHDVAHLKEDMGPLADQLDLSKMTEQELEFHYFQLHDVDNNTKLDGLEILHAIQHTQHENDVENVAYGSTNANGKPDSEYESDLPWIIELIDRVLEEDDLNNDGYLEYLEYVIGRQKDQTERAKGINKLKISK